MRGLILDALFDRMADDPTLFFLTADMGIGLVERFETTFPERYANVGIAEQNMIGVAAGLVNTGFRPFVYTISNFAVHRCFEQIRNEIGIHRAPITILGTSTGYDNAPLGPTHHVIDEWGSIKTIPGIDIYCPSSTSYAAALVGRVLDEGRPAYIRIPKGAPRDPEVADHLVYRPGSEKRVLLMSYGPLAQTCLAAQAADPTLSVLVFNRLRPIDEEALAGILGAYDHLVVVEDHFPDSGLYGSCCDIVVRQRIPGRVTSLAPTDYSLEVGTSPAYFHRMYRIDREGIAKAVGALL